MKLNATFATAFALSLAAAAPMAGAQQQSQDAPATAEAPAAGPAQARAHGNGMEGMAGGKSGLPGEENHIWKGLGLDEMDLVSALHKTVKAQQERTLHFRNCFQWWGSIQLHSLLCASTGML